MAQIPGLNKDRVSGANLKCFCLWVAFGTLVLLQNGLFARQESSPVRRIDFRDGSSLEVVVPGGELVWKNIAKDGQVTERKIPFSKVKQISLVREPSTSRVAKIRNLLSQLGSEDYHKRIQAQIRLTETGKEFEPIIEQYVPDDEETKWRISKVKEHLKEISGPSNTTSTFDVIVLDGEEGQLDGELDLTGLKVKYGNTDIAVTRDLVASISDQPLLAEFALSTSTGGGARQQDYPDANGTMPVGMNFIDFERLPDGKDNSVNLDVSKAYVAAGVLFSTSFTDSYVGTQNYRFTNGRGGMYSIANMEPTYQGTITISFCVPGNELFAAGTRYVGFNVSHVNPEGTWFEAYDGQGQLITKFTTDQSNTDYLGFRSEVPIAKVVVRPNPEVDEDFAIDDLFFESPVALLESGNPNFFSIVTRKGERLQADGVAVADNQLVLSQLSFGVPKISVPVEDVWVMIPAQSKQKKFALDAMNNYCYCLLDDGSIVLGDLGSQKRVNFGKKAIDLQKLVAFWGIGQQMAAPPTLKIKQGAALVFSAGQYHDLENIKFGKAWLESPSIADLAKNADQSNEDETKGIDLTKSRYADSLCVFLKSPNEFSEKLGVLYTFDGERYFIGEGLFSVDVNESGVSLSKGDDKASLGWDEIKSLRLPKN